MSFSAPTDEQVSEAIRRTPTPQLRRAFYEGLQNPLWLKPLKDAGAFRTPPPRITMDDGSIGDPYWPEIEYVVRVAGDSPTVAVDILLDLKDSDNAWVRRALFAIGAKVPASETARLKPVLKAWLGSGFGWRTDPREMVDFTVNLITGGERKTGEWVANAIFRPGSQEGSHKPDLVLEEYWYEAGLPEVVNALGPTGLSMVLSWLIEYAKAADQLDGWSLSRPHIREREDMHRDVEDALIDAVRDLAIEAIRADPMDAVELLLRPNLMLVRRISLFATTTALADAEPGTAPSAALVAAAGRLIFDQESNDERCRVEFAELAREVARHDPSILEPLVEYIAAGPGLGASELRERLRRDADESEETVEARVLEYSDRWEHSWLASIGASALPAILQLRLADLDERFGVIDDPLRPPFMITSWSGPTSPTSRDEMAGMSPAELMGYLETWHDRGDGWGPEPSHEGQARELIELITVSPQSLSGVSDLVSRLRPTYLRAILRGWSAAFKANLDLDWDQVTRTIRDVLDHRDELDFPREGGDMDDDPDFVWAKQAAVSLLDDLLKKVEPPRIQGEVLLELADLLIDRASSEAAWVTYAAVDDEGSTDPLNLSLNWQWPIRLRGLASLVAYGLTAPWSERARSALLKELDQPDHRGASHAVIGEHLGRFLNADEEWTTSHIGEWFGDSNGIDRGQQIALSTAIAIHYYHAALFKLLGPSMMAAIALPEIADGWSHHNSTPIQRIGTWVVKALIFADADWDHPLVSTFFDTVDAEARGSALGRVAWEFMHANEVDAGIRDRFASIWDARFDHVASNSRDSAELREFYWVVRSGKFEAQWWLPRLARALELDPELASQRYMIGEDLAKSADVDPRAAFEVVRRLVATRQARGFGWHDLSANAVPIVLARALSVGDDGLRSEAIAYMNELGEAGYLDLGRQVQAALNGESA
jgi:hypothetical protein